MQCDGVGVRIRVRVRVRVQINLSLDFSEKLFGILDSSMDVFLFFS